MENLKLDKKTYEKMFNLTQEILCVIYLNGRFKYVNPAFNNILGYSTDEVEELSVFSIIHPDDKNICDNVLLLIDKERQDIGNFKFRYKCKDGKFKCISWNLKFDLDEGVYYGAGHDISNNSSLQQMVYDNNEKLKATIAKLDLEEDLRLQEEFFLNVSHELKTPLNVIFSAAQLFNLYIKNGSLIENQDKLEKYINVITQNCYRQSKLVNNIVDLSKIKSGFFILHLSNQNIVSVVDEIVQSISEYVENKGLRIVFDTDIEEKIIACDPINIERVMLNLISNAIKFSTEGDKIFIDILDKGDSVTIAVTDTGIGIEADQLEVVFERFKQVDKSLSRNSEGSGIGLCLVKSIVELHSGRIKLESEIGKGSKFTIELPSKVVKIPKCINKDINSKIQTINIEFSDIYT